MTSVSPKRILLLALTLAPTADSRSVGQIPSRHIGSAPAGGVAVARGVVKERLGSAGGVVAAGGVDEERLGSAGGVDVARGVAAERWTPLAVLVARGVGESARLRWRCWRARGVDGERKPPLAVLAGPWCC